MVERFVEMALFVGAWLREPAATGAISPSGPSLARLMTQALAPDGGPVVELGPGTGVFTRAMLARGLPEASLVLVERDAEFARRLRLRYPQATVLHMDARGLRRQPRPRRWSPGCRC
jgi:phosphatidylethanolamine/phosphatidyl-N-methylethanolamine N-methyltransferase